MSGEPRAPSLRRILVTLTVSLVAAAVILVTVVLPAEYQIDPTGVGKLLGLDRLGGSGGSVDLAMAEAGTVVAYDGEIRREVVTVDLSSREEVELKIAMLEGAAVIFSWKTDRGEVYSDFHAEPFNDLDDEPLRYAEEEGVSSGSGALNAPFSGLHGWYWRNDNDFPLQVTLEASGFFTGVREVHRAQLD